MERGNNAMPTTGPMLMVLGALGFVGYAVVFFFHTFVSTGFELGVDTLNGVTKEQLNAINPAIVHYMDHIHIALSGFIAAMAIAVGAIAWYSVREKQWWGWLVAVGAPVLALAVALPLHYTGGFAVQWEIHLAPIYAGTLVYVVGALMALRSLLGR